MSAPGRAGAVVAIARTELSRILRDRTQLFFVIVLPVVIIIVVGATFGAAPRHLLIGVVDLDGSAASARIATALEATETLDTKTFTDQAALEQDIRSGSLNGGVVIPAGYGDAVAAGSSVRLDLLAAQTDSTTPALQQAVQSVAEREGAVLAATAFAAGITGEDAEVVRARAEALDGTLPAFTVDVQTVGTAPRRVDNQYAYTAPSNLVLFVFINSLVVGGALVETRRLGVARRMLAAPVSVGTIVLGSGLTRFVFALLQSAIILVVGSLLFGVRWGDPLSAFLLVVVFALLGSAAGLLIGSLARNPEQASAIGIPVAMGLAMLGGCMWTLEVVPEPMRIIGHLTPHAWAMDGWIALVFEGGGLGDVWRDVLILVAYAVGLGALAVWRLRRALID